MTALALLYSRAKKELTSSLLYFLFLQSNRLSQFYYIATGMKLLANMHFMSLNLIAF